MSTTRAHLRTMHEKGAQHAVAMAKHHGLLAGHFRKLEEMSKAMEHADHSRLFGEIAKLHDAIAEEHASMGEHHVEFCKALDRMGKAAGMAGDFDLRDEGVLAGIPSIPAEEVTPVFRPGQRDFAKLAVDPVAESFLRVEE